MQLEAKRDDRLTVQSVSIDEKEVSLRRKITMWQKIQEIYMTCVDGLRPATSGREEEANEEEITLDSVSACDIPLFLPESIPANLRSGLPSKLMDKYQKL